MLAVPPAFLEQLHLQAGTSVGLVIDQGRLVVAPHNRPRYTLDELLENSDYSVEIDARDNDWVNGAAVGGELL